MSFKILLILINVKDKLIDGCINGHKNIDRMMHRQMDGWTDTDCRVTHFKTKNCFYL